MADPFTFDYEFNFVDKFDLREFRKCPDAATDDGTLRDAVDASVTGLKNIISVQTGIRCISSFVDNVNNKRYKVTLLNSAWVSPK